MTSAVFERRGEGDSAGVRLALVLCLLAFMSVSGRAQSIITAVAGNGVAAFAGDGGPATKASFRAPYGVAVDAAGNVYIADRDDHRIRKVTPAGAITNIAGNGTAGFSDAGGAATAASLNSPTGVAVEAAGNIYVADKGNHRIRKIDAAGVISTVAGTGSAAFSGDGGAATEAALNSPSSVAVDAAGNVYIADTGNQRIRKISRGSISTVAGGGASAGDGVPATTIALNSPQAVALDALGHIYIADSAGAAVFRVASDGRSFKIAGGGTNPGDGVPATAAQLLSPAGLATDAAGNIYIADFQDHRVRVVNVGGVIATVAGSASLSGFGGDGGWAALAAFVSPSGLAAGPATGQLYIADAGTSRVRQARAVLAGGAVVIVSGNNQSQWAGTPLQIPLQVQVVNGTLAGVANATVSFSVVEGGATLSASSVLTGSDGTARIAATLGTAAGMVVVHAAAPGIAAPAAFTFTATAGQPAAVTVVSGNNQTAVAGSALLNPPVVSVIDQYGNAVSAVAVNVAVASGGGSLPGGSVVTTGSDGQARINWMLGATPGTNTLAASVAGVAGSLTVTARGTTPAGAAISIVSGNNQTGPVNGALANPLIVQARATGRPSLPGVTVNFAVTAGSATLSAATAVTDANGWASVTVALSSTAGAVTVTASVPDFPAPAVFTATALAQPAAVLSMVAGNNQAAAPGAALPNPLVVKAADAYGNPIPGVALNFAPAAGGGMASPASASTGADGQAQTTWTLGSTAGTKTLTVWASGVPPTATFIATVTTTQPASLAIVSGDGQSAPILAALPTPLVVQVNSVSGTGIAGITVLFAVSAGSASLSAASAVTDSNGRARVTATLGNKAGAVATTASVANFSASLTATATPLPASQLKIVSGSAQSAVAGSALPEPVRVRVSDAYDNPIAGATVNFSVGAGGGSVSATSVVTDAAGQAQVTWTMGTAAGDNTMTVWGGSKTATVTAKATAPPPAALVIVSGNNQSAPANTVLAAPLVVQVNSAGGAGLSGASVRFSVITGGATLSSQNIVTDSSGQAQVTVTLPAAPGVSTIQASISSPPLSVLFHVTAAPVAVAGLSMVSGDAQTATAGRAVPSPLVVKAVDSSGHPVAGALVSITVTAGGGTVSAPSVLTGANGQAQVSWILGGTPGANTLSAASGAAAPVSFTASATAAVPAIWLVSGNNQTANAGAALPAPLVVAVRDAAGLPVAGAAVTFALTSGTATVTTPAAITDSSGLASTTVRLGTVSGTATISASAAGVAGAVVFTCTGLTGPPALLAIVSGSSQVGPVGAVLPLPLVVKLTDSSGNPASNALINSSMIAGNGALGSVTARTGADGQAQFTWTLGNTAGANSVYLYHGTLPGVTFTATATAPIATNTIATVAGTGPGGYSGDGGPATAATLYHPGGLALDAVGSLLIADTLNHRIRRLGADGIINTIAGIGTASLSGDGGPAGAAGLNGPQAVALDAAGNLYIADTGNHRIRKVSAAGSIQTRVACDPTAPVYICLSAPAGVALDAAGNLFIADTGNDRVLKLTAGGLLTLVAGGGGLSPGDGAPATYALLRNPAGLTVDSAGNLFFAEADNHRIRRVGTDGGITTVAGAGGAGYTGDGVPATQVWLDAPQAVALDAGGNLLIADTMNHRIRQVAAGIIATVAGNGTAGFQGDGGWAPAASLYSPGAVAIDAGGNIYVADTWNNRIRKVSPAPLAGTVGSVTVVSGNNQTAAVNSTLAAPLVVQVKAGGGAPLAGAAVNFTADAGGPVLSASRVIAGTDGRAQVSAAFGSKAGNFLVYASVPGVPLAAVFSLSAAPGPPDSLKMVSGSNQSATTGTALSKPLQVKLTDANGNPLSGLTVNFDITPGTGTLSAYTAVTDASGQAQTAWTLGGTAGTYTLTASFGTLAPVTFTATATAAAPRISIVSGDLQSGMVNSTLPSPLVVSMKTAAGVALPGVTVTFSLASGSATVSAINVVANSSGQASVTVTLSPTPGTARIRATSAGVTSPVTFTCTATAGPAALVTIMAGDNQTGRAGTLLPVPLTVRVQDQFYNPVPAASVAFDVLSGGGSLSVASAITGADGQAQASWTLGSGAGVNTAQAAAGAASPVVFTATGTGPAAGGIITTVAGGGGAAFPHAGPALSAPLGFLQGVAVDSFGNTFVSDATNHLVVRISSTGTQTVVAGNGAPGYSGDGSQAASASLNAPYGLSVDTVGNLYIADSANHRIRRVGADGLISTVAGAGVSGFTGEGGPAASAELSRPRGVLFDSLGNLYIADTGNHMVRRVSAAGIITAVAGTGAAGFGGDTGQARNATLSSPSAMALGAAGNLYIADTGNRRVRKVTAAGIISTMAGGCSSGCTGDGGAATAASPFEVLGLALDSSGDLYLTDHVNHRVRRISTAGIISAVAGDGVPRFYGDGLPALLAEVAQPYGVAVDASGNVFIADSGNYRLRKADAAGLMSTVAGNGAPKFFGDGVAAVNAQLSSPAGIALDAAGSLYIADQKNLRIRRVSAAGTMATAAGNGVAGFSGDGGPAAAASLTTPGATAVDAAGNFYFIDGARVRKVDVGGTITTLGQFSNPGGLVVDAAGNVYVAETATHRIRRIAPAGTLTTVAGTGTAAFSGDGGPATAARLSSPRGLALDAAGNLFIADTGNYAVRRLQPDGIIITAAGNGTRGYSGDGGAATAAQMMEPVSVAVDTAGSLLVADLSAQCVRQVSPDGSISTVAGNGVAGFSGDGGPATSASLNRPVALAADSAGSLYIADQDNDRIRRIAPSGLSIVAGDNQNGVVNQALPGPLVVQLKDATGAAIAGVAVNFAVTAGSATLDAASVTTAADGKAQVTATMGTTAGAVAVRAWVAGFAGSVLLHATASQGPPALLTIVSGDNQRGAAGAALVEPLVVKVADQYGNPIAGVAVVFALAWGGGSLSASSPNTGANGQAQVSWTLGADGANTVTASAGALLPLTFNATALIPATVTVVSGSFQSAPANTAVSNPLVVQVSDAGGVGVPGVTVSFAPATAGSATLSSAAAVTGANGQAQISALMGSLAGSFTVNASVAGIAAPAVFTLIATLPPTGGGGGAVGGGGGGAVGGGGFPGTSPPDFTLSVSPAGQSVIQGGAVTYLVSIVGKNSFAFPVNFSCGGLPADATCSFTPNPALPGIVTLQVATAEAGSTGAYEFSVNASGGGVSHSAKVSLEVLGTPGFRITVAPAFQWAAPGQAANYTITITRSYGFTSAVNLACSGLPANANCSFVASPAAPDTILLSVTVPDTLAAGTIAFIISATSGSLTASARAELGVGGTLDFQLSVSPASRSVTAGTAAVYTVTVSSLAGFSSAVSLSCSNLPSGATCSFSPNPALPGASSLTVTTAASMTSGTAVFTIAGTSGSLSHAATASLSVAGSDFLVKVAPSSQAVLVGGSVAYSVSIVRGAGFMSPVALTCTGLPAGANCVFSPNPAPAGDAALTVATTAGTPVGRYTFTVTGTGDSVSQTFMPELIVNREPDFALSVLPASQAVERGAAAVCTVRVDASGNFSAPVTLACQGLPAGAACSFSPNPVLPGNSTLTVTTAATTPAGRVSFTVTGVSGSLSRVASVALTIGLPPSVPTGSVTNGASFTAGATPGSIVTIFGTHLSSLTSGVVVADKLPLPRELRGTSVTVNGMPAPLFAIANVNGLEQINLQIPYEVTGQTAVSIVVTNNGVASDPIQIPLQREHPGIFTVDGTAGAILRGSDNLPVTSSRPATAGDVVVIYATGLGPVSPAPPTGQAAAASPLSWTMIPPLVMFAGAVATDVLYSGLAPGFAGLYQVNVRVPREIPTTGNIDVVIQTAGQISKPVKMALR